MSSQEITIVTNDDEEYDVSSDVVAFLKGEVIGNEMKVDVDALTLDSVIGFLEELVEGEVGSEGLESDAFLKIADGAFVEYESLDGIRSAGETLGCDAVMKWIEQRVKGLKKKGETVFSLEEVMKHDQIDDCWLVIDSLVYDVTEWIPKHPGKEQIMNGVGKESVFYMEIYHKTKRSKHLLRRYWIGVLDEQGRGEIDGTDGRVSEEYLEALRKVTEWKEE